MINNIEIKVRKSKIPLSNGKFVDKSTCKVYVNEVNVFEGSTDSYSCTHQELMDKALAFVANVRFAFSITGNVFSVKQTTF